MGKEVKEKEIRRIWEKKKNKRKEMDEWKRDQNNKRGKNNKKTKKNPFFFRIKK